MAEDKRIFILGAGASISHSCGIFPTISTFFKAFKEHSLDLKLGQSELAGELEAIETYVSSFYSKTLDHDNIDIEEMMSLAEIELERNPHNAILLRFKQSLISFIRTLLYKLDRIVVDDDASDYYRLRLNLSANDTILTFNWDCMLDDILGRISILFGKKSGVQNDQYSNFYSTLTANSEYTVGALSPSTPYESGMVRAEDKGYYLKMHGSTDWLYCQNENCREHNFIYPTMDALYCKVCGYCHEELECLLIPPLFNKGIRSHPTVRRIWNLARQELLKATEIIIWGYSLPPTDFYSLWLLRQARHNRLNKLTIINPEAKPDSQLYCRLSKPFENILYDGSITVFNDFSEYYESVSSNPCACV